MADSSPTDLENLLSEATASYSREEYQAAINGFKKAHFLAQSEGNVQKTAISLANLGAAHIQVGDYSSACDSLEQAQQLMVEIGDRRGECHALINLGTIYEHLHHLEQSLNAWQSALDLARQMFDSELAGIAMRGLAGVTKDLGRLNEAQGLYEKLLGYYEKVGDESEQTDLLLDLARIDLELGDTTQAELQVQKALHLTRKNEDVSAEAYCFYRLGTIYFRTGFTSEARDFLSRAVAFFREQNDQERLGTALNDLGMVYSSMGLYQEGLAVYQESLKITEITGDRVDQGGCLHGIGHIYHQIGNLQDALSYYERALELTETEGDWVLASQTLTNLGVVYADLGRNDDALSTLQRALKIQQAAGDLLSQGKTLISIAALYMRNDDLDHSFNTYQQALEIQKQTGDRDAQAATLYHIGEILVRTGRVAEALEHKEEALKLFEKVSKPVGQIQTLYSIAQIYNRTGQLPRAVEVLEQAIALIESMRLNLLSETLRTSYFSHMHNIYALYVEVLLALDRTADAFLMMEQSKARAFLDLLSEAQADFQSSHEPRLHQEEQTLLTDIENCLRQIDALTSQPESTQVDDQIRELEIQMQELERRYQINQGEIRSRNPRYAALTQPAIWGISQVQRELLDDHTALLEYILGENVSSLFVITKDDFEIFRLPPRAEIEVKVRELRASISLHRYAHGDTLYRDLILPATQLIEGKDLLIVADGALHYLPFSLLLTAPPETGTTDGGPHTTAYRSGQTSYEDELLTQKLEGELAALPPFDFIGLPYLLREHAIRYAPSASVAGHMQQESANKALGHQNALQIAAMADPLVQGELKAPSGSLRSLHGNLAALPYTADEVWALASLFEANLPAARTEELRTQKVHLYTGLNATKNRILDLTGGNQVYRFLHIATHGLLNVEEPQFSGLLFSSETGHDPYWQTFEIFKARVPAETVVLSACETGLGKVVRGEGLIGLTRAFLYAGADRVCVSLWKVADISTPDLMKYFYEYMLEGKNATNSLRKAQLRLVDEGIFSHPFYWAPFVVVGSL